jgi:hypothetical protein
MPGTRHCAAAFSVALLCAGAAAATASAQEPSDALPSLRRPDGTALPADEILDEVGLTDDDESPEAEALLEDEGIEPPPRRRARDRNATPAFSAWLPRITLKFVGWQSSQARAGWQAWVVLTATWERVREPRIDRDALAAERARRSMALTVDERRLMSQPPDPERTATLDAIHDEWEAIR